jgi:hypothetical protein
VRLLPDGFNRGPALALTRAGPEDSLQLRLPFRQRKLLGLDFAVLGNRERYALTDRSALRLSDPALRFAATTERGALPVSWNEVAWAPDEAQGK